MSEGLTKDLIDGRSFEERVFARFDAMDARFDGVDARLESLGHRVQALEIQNEKRSLETKPIWERALAEIAEVRQGVEDLARKFNLIHRDVVQVRADQVRLEDRMDKLDSNPS